MNQSIHRAFLILRVIATHQPHIGITEIANQANLHKSTVSRMVATLCDVGAIQKEKIDGREGYCIGTEISFLAQQGSPTERLKAVAEPIMQEMAAATGETINLCIPEEQVAHYICQHESQYDLQIKDWTGRRIPLHACVDGKVFLAWRPREAINAYLMRPLERFTPTTICDSDALLKNLTDIYQQGYAETYGEYETGIFAISVPVLDPQDETRVLASICIGGPEFRFPDKKGKRPIIELMQLKSAELTKLLGRLSE